MPRDEVSESFIRNAIIKGRNSLSASRGTLEFEKCLPHFASLRSF